jgi:anti-sigma regulatory factor (Ser/Thr protein kinase)
MEMNDRVIAGELSVRVGISGQSDIGECRRTAKRLAEAGNFAENDVGKICIVATELATNIVRHGGGGEMLMQMLNDGATPQLEMLAIDRGPGMQDVERCLRDGYSTGGTPGTGLGAVSRLSSTFDIFSVPGAGTVVLSRIGSNSAGSLPSSGTDPLQFGAICIALAGEIECGDTWRIVDRGSVWSVMVADGLGHGPMAATAARAAAQAFTERPFDDPSSLMQSLHGGLTATRGAVAACARLHTAEARVDYAGIGNIYGSIVGRERSRGMVSHNGTLGLQIPRPRQFAYDWAPGELVVMHSDGLSARWNLAEHPGLYTHHAGVIAGVLYRDAARKRDDATVVVMRCQS